MPALDLGQVVGPQGPIGPVGPAGPQGHPGADGVSPYQVAQENGYTGTEADFNSCLAGLTEMWTLRNGTAIPANSDLNEYINLGNYFCGSSATAQTLLNAPALPFAMPAFVLKIFNITSTSICQIIITHSAQTTVPNYYFIREKLISGNWNAWAQIGPTDLSSLGITATADEINLLDGTPSEVTNNLAALSLAPTILIPENSDLDDYLTPGSFRVENRSAAASITNSPITNAGYDLHVFQTYGLGTEALYRTQIAMTYSGIFFIRYRDSSGVFHEWNQMKLFGTTLADLGITATATELNYLDGATSNIQDQLNAITGQIGDIAAQLDAINGEVV